MNRESRRPERAADGFVYPRYTFRTPPELDRAGRTRHPVVVVGAGMVGLTMAADLGARGLACVVLDDNDTVAGGSRAIAQARKSLQVWDRVGAAGPMAAKGLAWNHARHLHGSRVVSAHELYPEAGHKFPPMLILPQYYVESDLVERCAELPAVDIRWKNAVREVAPAGDHVALTIDTPRGAYELEADWLVAADGVGSMVRRQLGLPFEGRRVEDRFIIVDVVVDDDFPPGRSFWFKQPFHDGNSTLFLRQPEQVCRVDFNIGRDADAEIEMTEARLVPKLRAMFGPGRTFEIRWVSLYTVEVRRLDRFRHGRVVFIGDAAHQLSPFSGGRGGNSGVEDADNLGWKLARVVRGESPASLLGSYEAERIPIADENIRYSLRATEFISPSFAMSDVFQTAALTLAATQPFARVLLNSGRFSTTSRYADSPLNAADGDADLFAAPRTAPGSAAVDAPVRFEGRERFLVELLGDAFCLMLAAQDAGAGAGAAQDAAALAGGAGAPLRVLVVAGIAAAVATTIEGVQLVIDADGLVGQRYGLAPGSAYLFRPDQRIAGRWRRATAADVRSAVARACGI